jgi:acyl carrier protein
MAHENSRKKAVGNQAETGIGILEIVKKLAEEIHPGQSQTRPVTLNSSLDREVGLNSLARMELLARIERNFGINLPERVLVDAETPRDLLRSVLGTSTSPLRDAARKHILQHCGEPDLQHEKSPI